MKIINLPADMSDLLLKDEKSNEVLYSDKHPPQYDSCQPRPDLLTSVIENHHDEQLLLKRLWKFLDYFKTLPEIRTTNPDYAEIAKNGLVLSRRFAEMEEVAKELSTLYRERTCHDPGLYIIMSRLTESEFDQIYASLGIHSRQRQQKENEDKHHFGRIRPRARGYNRQGSQKTNTSGHAPAQPPKNILKRISKFLSWARW
jgi:hypothetical protein